MEIGLGCAMGQGPVAFAAFGGFDDCAKAEPQGFAFRQKVRAEFGLKLKTIAQGLHRDDGGARRRKAGVALTVIREAIGRPLARWREIEFPVLLVIDWGNEGFAARVLPEIVGRAGCGWQRHLKCPRHTAHKITQGQAAGGGRFDRQFNGFDRGAWCRRVAKQMGSYWGEQGDFGQ